MAEAIINAVAHRDYTSPAAIQVSLFADRLEVWNPGELPPPLTPDLLRRPHHSIARNHRICEALFLTRYIEKYGTGTLMMIRECASQRLPEPQFEQRAGEFVTTIWRDWLTDKVLAELQLNDRQRKGILQVKITGSVTSGQYQTITGAPPRTATRDLDELVTKGLLRKVGKIGRGAHYALDNISARNRPNRPAPRTEKSAINRPNRTSPETRHKPDKPDSRSRAAKEAKGAPMRTKRTTLPTRRPAKISQRAQRSHRSPSSKRAINVPNVPSLRTRQKQNKRDKPGKPTASRPTRKRPGKK